MFFILWSRPSAKVLIRSWYLQTSGRFFEKIMNKTELLLGQSCWHIFEENLGWISTWGKQLGYNVNEVKQILK